MLVWTVDQLKEILPTSHGLQYRALSFKACGAVCTRLIRVQDLDHYLFAGQSVHCLKRNREAANTSTC
jgi:hypothetical protein